MLVLWFQEIPCKMSLDHHNDYNMFTLPVIFAGQLHELVSRLSEQFYTFYKVTYFIKVLLLNQLYQHTAFVNI